MAKPDTVLTTAQISQLQKLSGFGLTVEKLAHFFGFNKRTLERMMKRDPRVKVAVERGRASAEAQVSQSLFDSATKHGNVTAMIFYLKCKGGWRDPNVVKHEGLKSPEKSKQASLVIDLTGKNVELKE